MRRNGYHRSALIETLHVVQGAFGYLDPDALKYVSLSLGVPLSRTYGVSTFYHLFRLKPGGRHSCVVCQGTACYIKGSAEILQSIRDVYGIVPGETTADGQLSLLTARCLGTCSLAPVTVVDNTVSGNQDPQKTLEMLGRMADSDV
jgi:bidirectional [NiFe] hydrogenase diaphorase subunit